uniref:Uncharacterized protein n=1 Tax=Trypanosoma congolense (strain IL3000) TaxID=1068625 RepID=G0UZ44_TRYCI|nr:conserved hypothetical protein [Trypanosoma congolense IL3000]
MTTPCGASERRQRASLRSKKRWVRRGVWLVACWVGAIVISRVHPDSLRLYVIVVMFIALFSTLSRRRRRVHQSDAAEGEQELPGDITALKRRCVEFMTLRAIGTPEAIRAIRDREFRENLVNCPPDAPLCCCGSGRPLAVCCRPLQVELLRCAGSA